MKFIDLLDEMLSEGKGKGCKKCMNKKWCEEHPHASCEKVGKCLKAGPPYCGVK